MHWFTVDSATMSGHGIANFHNIVSDEMVKSSDNKLMVCLISVGVFYVSQFVLIESMTSGNAKVGLTGLVAAL